MSLHKRIRPGSEAAPWVCDEVKKLEARVKELEAENAGLRNRGAVCFSVQELDNYLAFNVETGQIEIYETEYDANRNRRAGYTIKKVRVVKADDEEEA